MASIAVEKHRLLLDFRWQGQRCREYLGDDDSKDGWAAARKRKKILEGKMLDGTFDYAAEFPNSKKVRPGGVFAPPPAVAEPAADLITLGPYVERFLAAKKGRWSNAHHAEMTSIFKGRIVPYFHRDRPIASFDGAVTEVELFLAETANDRQRGEGKLSPARVNTVRAALRDLLGRAVVEKKLASNPVLAVKCLRVPRTHVDPLDADAVRVFLMKGFGNDDQSRRFYTVAIFTGMRPSELIGLKWTMIDWAKSQADIQTVFTKEDGEHAPKTEQRATTLLDLRPAALRALKEQRAASRLKTQYVFCNALGGPLDADNMRSRVWTEALKRSGIRYRPPGQCRHTFATLALENGEKIGWVSKQLGHVDTEMVIRHYYRWIPQVARDGAGLDKVAARLGL